MRMIAILLAGGLCSFPLLADALDEDLAKLKQQAVDRNTDTGHLEQQYLQLLEKYREPEEKGRIHFAACQTICSSGLRNPDGAIRHAREALSYPISPSLQMRAYLLRGDACRVKNRGTNGRDKAHGRVEAARFYLAGIRVGLEHDAPNERVPLPSVMSYDVPKNDPGYEAIVEEHRRQLAARREAEALDELATCRSDLEGQLVDLYARRPFVSKELSKLAMEILEDQEAVNYLMDKVERETKDK